MHGVQDKAPGLGFMHTADRSEDSQKAFMKLDLCAPDLDTSDADTLANARGNGL